MKEQIIQLPDNLEVKEIKDGKIILVEKEKKLPKTWKEYCETHPRRKGESWINEFSTIVYVGKLDNFKRDFNTDKNTLPNREYAEAMLALCQLIQLRDCYNDGWVPNWNDMDEDKYSIVPINNTITDSRSDRISRVLSFKTKELCTKFLENFRDLIEIAKLLL